MSNTEISKRFKLTNSGNIDDWYGPYSSINEANSIVPNVTSPESGENFRKGKTVGITTSLGIVEYFWKNKFTDAGLVRKSIDGEELGLVPVEVLDSAINECVDTGVISGNRTVIFNRPLGADDKASGIQLWCTVAGTLTIGVYTISAGKATRARAIVKTMALGLNDVSEISPGTNEYFGIAYSDAVGSARVGFFTGHPSTYTYYSASVSIGTTPVTLPTAINTTRWGVSIKIVSKSSIAQKTNSTSDYVFLEGNLLDEVTSSMSAQGKWVVNTGAPTMSFASGIMAVTFTSGNQNVHVPNAVEIGKELTIKVRARVASGSIKSVQFGQFTSLGGNGQRVIQLTNTFAEYTFNITGTGVNFSIGALTASNTGGIVEIDYVKIIDNSLTINKRINDQIKDYLLNYSTDSAPNSFFLSGLFSALSKFDKALIKIAVLGDSLMANALGGAYIPEGNGYAPMRLTYNTIARRLYELLSWNKPTHVRLTTTDWTKSGTWSAIDGNINVFEPVYDNERYSECTTSSAYAEIVVPDGMENFALICQKFTGFGKLNVTLNGGSIATYGPTQIDLIGGGETGNPYYTIQYLGLPPGANTIRISKETNTDKVRVWGGFYWHGTTLVVQNISHGGHTMGELITQHLQQELLDNNFDAVLFEQTLMNEMSTTNNIDESVANFGVIMSSYIGNKDVLVMNCLPFGTDPSDGTPNYYTLRPGMKELAFALRKSAYDRKVPFIDVFTAFERKVINRGGSLDGGQSGLWYTTDGQHPNPDGVREWFNIIKSAFKDTPILNS